MTGATSAGKGGRTADGASPFVPPMNWTLSLSRSGCSTANQAQPRQATSQDLAGWGRICYPLQGLSWRAHRHQPCQLIAEAAAAAAPAADDAAAAAAAEGSRQTARCRTQDCFVSPCIFMVTIQCVAEWRVYCKPFKQLQLILGVDYGNPFTRLNESTVRN